MDPDPLTNPGPRTGHKRRDEMKKNELHEGIGGNGQTIWMVVTINTKNGQWLWVENFTSKGEAEAWIRSSAY